MQPPRTSKWLKLIVMWEKVIIKLSANKHQDCKGLNFVHPVTVFCFIFLTELDIMDNTVGFFWLFTISTVFLVFYVIAHI